MIKVIFRLAILTLFIQSCQQKEIKRESVLDKISHIEDSIHYHIDSLPMLCNELGMKGQLVNIGDCKLYCEVAGTGAPMVLINGGPGGTHHYFHPWFGKAESFCNVIYYDQRGCGQSDFNKGDGYTFRQAVDDLDKLRQKLGIDKWIVCGFSYGGALAQYYTLTYPEHVMGTVLIGAAPCLQNQGLDNTRQYDYISEEEQQRINNLYERYQNSKLNLLQLLFNKDINGDWKRQNFYKPTHSEAIRAAWYEWVNDKGFNYAMGTSYSGYDFKHAFDNNPIPTLLCEGKWDLTWTAEKAEILKQNHPKAQLVMFEKAGHSIYNEEPKLFFSTLKNFVTTLKPASTEEVERWKQDVAKIIVPQEVFFAREANFFSLIEKEGVDKAVEYYKAYKKENEDARLFVEEKMNKLGYASFYKKDYASAIKLFELNVEAYPESYNVYDSLGEAYLAAGDVKNAKLNYEKSLVLNPKNDNAKKVLDDLISK